MKYTHVEDTYNTFVTNEGRFYRKADDDYIEVVSKSIPYRYVSLNVVDSWGKRKTLSAHRIVATYFVHNPKPEIYNIVNHKNGMKNDNRPSNLEWCSMGQNREHAKRNGLKNYRGLCPSIRIEIWKKYGELGKTSITDVMREYGLTRKAALNALYLNSDGSSKYDSFKT